MRRPALLLACVLAGTLAPAAAQRVASPTHTISEIQGTGPVSPLVGRTVTTRGIVTGVKPNGFFIQSQTGDGNRATSDGVLVFTAGPAPAEATVGNLVSVTGRVLEFVPPPDPDSPPMTEIDSPTSIAVISRGNALPAPITLRAADTSPTGSIEQLERLEGMRVHVDSLTASGPTLENVEESTAIATSTGVTYGVITGIARPFREPGIEAPEPLPARPCCIPRFDANPERLRIDSNGLVGGPLIDVTTGTILTNLTGPLDYSFRCYTILPDPRSRIGISGGIRHAVPVPAANSTEITIASTNLERLFDTVDTPPPALDPVLSPTALSTRLKKISLAIRDVLRTPDIVAVEEVENLALLQSLARQMKMDEEAAGRRDPAYQAYLVEGNDIGGIDVGFLVKTGRVTVAGVTQEGKDATFADPSTGRALSLNDRPSLALDASVRLPGGAAYPLVVIANHLKSLIGVKDAVNGPQVRAKRRAQAEFLARVIQARQVANPSTPLVAIGDFNAFNFSDGMVDGLGTIMGSPTDATKVMLASPDLVTPNLVNLLGLLPPAERYTYVYDGNAQSLDHVLVTANLAPFARVAIARNGADFTATFRNDPTRPERISDHDIAVTYLSPCAPVAPAAVTLARGRLDRVASGARRHQTLTLRNGGEGIIGGPIAVALDGLSEGVRIADGMAATGRTSCDAPGGSPWIEVPLGADSVLTPGESVTVQVEFENASGPTVDYSPRLLAGPGLR